MDSAPAQIGSCQVVGEIGRGAMGVVYLARDSRLDRDVAVKALPHDLASDPDRRARFEREAKLLASLSHPNIAAVYGLEEAGGQHYLVLEHVEGEDLSQRLERGAIALDETLDLAAQIAAALEAAHEKGVIHRDVKPANIKLTPGGVAKVLDFGLAKTVDDTGSASAGAAGAAGTATIQRGDAPTVSGMVLGTPGFMSPEQARGEPADRRSDLFAFGCVLYEMLTGRAAFPGRTAMDSMGAILHREPDWTALPAHAPPPLQRLVRRCLQKDPHRRLQHAGDARVELEELRSERLHDRGEGGVDAGSRRLLLAAVAMVVIVGAAVGVRVLLRGDDIVYLIDTTSPLGVYHDETRSAGGTNADDLTDLLGDLPATLVKENVNPRWRREHQVLAQRPALVVVHRSAFAHQPNVADWEQIAGMGDELARLGLEDPYELGRSKLIAFLGYIGQGSPGTRFLVYSRSFEGPADEQRWVAEVETRFPELKGRIRTLGLSTGDPGPSFRDPEIGEQVKRLVVEMLGGP